MGDFKFCWHIMLVVLAYCLIRILMNSGEYRTRGWLKLFRVYISKRWILFGIYFVLFGVVFAGIIYSAVVTPEVKQNPISFYSAKIIQTGGSGKMPWTPVKIELLNGMRFQLSYTKGNCQEGETYTLVFNDDVVNVYVVQKNKPIPTEAERKFVEEHDAKEAERYLLYDKKRDKFMAAGVLIPGIIAIVIITITSFRRTLRVKRRRRSYHT